MPFDKSKYQMVPIELLIKPPTYEGDFSAYTKRWWEVKDDCLLFYKCRFGTLSPQCNRNKAVVENLTVDGRCHEKCEVIFLPVVYIPTKWTDECNEISFNMYDKMFDRD